MKIMKYAALSLIAVTSLFAEQNATIDNNSTQPPIIQFIDSNLLDQSGEYTKRNKDYIALYFHADWCPASRQMTSNVVDFNKLFGDNVCIVSVNIGNNDRWVFGRHRIPWKMVTPPSEKDLADYFGVTHIPKFILLNKHGESITGEKFKREIAYNEQ